MRAVLILGVGAAFVAATPVSGGEAAMQHRAGARVGRIDYAVDGDTLRVELADGELVYVPPGRHRHARGREARHAGRVRIEGGGLDARPRPEGAEVVLRPDSVADEYDRYGRLLAHAFIGGRPLELVQLRRGWAEVYRYDEQRFDGLARFDAVQASARRADRGVWGSCGGDFHSSR